MFNLKFIYSKTIIIHLAIIFLVALLYNSTYFILTDVPLRYQLNGDAEVHVAHWREFSLKEADIFTKDDMFKFDIRPAGELFIGKILARAGEFVGLDVLIWSLILSYISFAILLVGVYFVVSYSLDSYRVGFWVALGSIIPAYSLGGSSWGFTPHGFLPRELALGLAVWLLYLYFYSIKVNSIWHRRLVFLLAGLLANWYPVLFFHYVAVLILADIFKSRSIKLEHFLWGLIFIAGAGWAVADIITKSLSASPLNLEIFRQRFGYMLLDSWDYVFLRYLRRFIIYTVLVAVLYFLFNRKISYNEQNRFLKDWYAIFLSSGLLSLLGLYIENDTTLARLFISRTSVWFIFSAMVIIAYIFQAFGGLTIKKFKPLCSPILILIFIGQSMIPTVYRHISELRNSASDYKSFIVAMEELKDFVPPSEVILADPNQAVKIRAYGSRSTYVAYKDGNIALLDGGKATIWSNRMKEVEAVMESGDLGRVNKFALDHKIKYFLFDNRMFPNFTNWKGNILFSSGAYVLAQASN